MRKIAEIEICSACLIVVDGDPASGNGDTQAACALAAQGLDTHWEGLDVHGVGSEEGRAVSRGRHAKGAATRMAASGTPPWCSARIFRTEGERLLTVVDRPRVCALAVGDRSNEG